MSTQAKPKAQIVTVEKKERISGQLYRVYFSCTDPSGYHTECSGAHIKLFFPSTAQSTFSLPELSNQGLVWADSDQKPYVRTYTARHFDSETQWLWVDFVDHGDNGPASRWVRKAKQGDQIGLMGPGLVNLYRENADYYFLAGDLSATPMISAVLERLPANARGTALIEINNASDQHSLLHPVGISIKWLLTENNPHVQLQHLIEIANSDQWKQAQTISVTVAGESDIVVNLRQHLIKNLKLKKKDMYAVPYWHYGQNEEAYHAERHRVMDEEIDTAKVQN